MPLVVFNHDQALDGDSEDFVATVTIPERGRRAKWKLHAINVLYYKSARVDFAYVDVRFPELFQNENILSVADGGAPPDAFRFYNNRHQISGHTLRREPSVFGVVSEYPAIDLGERLLDTNTLSCVVSPHMGSHDRSSIRGYSIILSFEE